MHELLTDYMNLPQVVFTLKHWQALAVCAVLYVAVSMGVRHVRKRNKK
jgi:hypothetical protein